MTTHTFSRSLSGFVSRCIFWSRSSHFFKIRQISKKQPQDIRGRFFIFRSSSFYQDQGDFLIFKCNFFKDQPLQLPTKSSPKFLSLSIADPFIFKIFYLAKSSSSKISKPTSTPTPLPLLNPFIIKFIYKYMHIS